MAIPTIEQPKHCQHELAIVQEHVEGGWALPGGMRTHDREIAMSMARKIDQCIQRNGGRARALRKRRIVR